MQKFIAIVLAVLISSAAVYLLAKAYPEQVTAKVQLAESMTTTQVASVHHGKVR